MLQNPSTPTPTTSANTIAIDPNSGTRIAAAKTDAHRRQEIDSQLDVIRELMDALRNDQVRVDDDRRFRLGESFLVSSVHSFLSSVRATPSMSDRREVDQIVFWE